MKKASVVPTQHDPAKIAGLARALPEPADFYTGHEHTARKLPDNILLFHRTRAADLNNTTEAKAFHQRHVLIVPITGSGRVIANARAIPLSPGRCVLIAPFQFHHYTALSQPKIDWLFVTFTYGNHPLAHAATSVFSTPASFWMDLEELVRDFQDGRKSADRLAWRLALVLDCLAAASVPQTKPMAPVAREKLLLRVSSLASTHLHEPLPVAQLAKMLGLSSSHLRQRFQETAGISVGRFLREFRLRHAAELLATGQTNVTEAAAACGWDTPYAFSRAFRNYWGRPPKAFALAGRR
ncbi:MAG: AraC family transcriptional regulator [Lacunisphaera sp.]|nr:AraC family transcriptional regulator [Lacunisphaera sp.]